MTLGTIIAPPLHIKLQMTACLLNSPERLARDSAISLFYFIFLVMIGWNQFIAILFPLYDLQK